MEDVLFPKVNLFSGQALGGCPGAGGSSAPLPGLNSSGLSCLQ